MMEIGNEPAIHGGAGRVYHWWASASALQLGWGIYSLRKGYAGECRYMPVKAFGIASLFVGAAATAAVATLTAYGIHSVKDVMEVGANIRTGMGVRPRARRDE